jgi:hypothetical protein
VALQDPRFTRPFIIGKLHPPGTGGSAARSLDK